MPQMILPRIRLAEWTIATLFLLPFGASKDPCSNDGLASHGLHGDINLRTYGSSRRRRFIRNSSSLSYYHNIPSTSSRGKDGALYSRSHLSDPNLPKYPFEEVAGETLPRVHGEEKTRESWSFPDTEPHVTEPENETESVWSRHDIPHDDSGDEEAENELPHKSHEEDLAHSPVVYQYFGRSRSRVHTADSIPFILLGPQVDHWKTVGQTLASRGFSVMACEVADDNNNNNNKGRRKQPIPEEGKNLILAVLNALRWNKAVLVGCDKEAAMAIEAAIQLAPDRVAGLVLCGDLSSSDQLARKVTLVDAEQRLSRSQKQDDNKRHTALDALLDSYLRCPYTIVWDGDVSQSPSPPTDSSKYSTSTGDMFAFNRCLILGGGTAPHRRVPEQFAWALTRFVEEMVAPQSGPLMIQSGMSTDNSSSRKRWVGDFFSPGSMLVVGRVFASVVFYITAMKIGVYQYENLRGGVIGIHSLVQWLRSSKERVFHSTASFITNYGYVFSLFRSLVRGTKPSTPGEFVMDDTGKETEPRDDNEIRSSENDIREEEKEEEPKEMNEDARTEEDEDDMHQDDHKSDEEKPETTEGEHNEQPPRLMLLDLVVV